MKLNTGNTEAKWFRAGGSILGTLICKLKLLYIKRCDAFNNATLGTHLGFGASFVDIPNFPHGLYGIVISHDAVIGRNCTIYHQVTIGEGRDRAPRTWNNASIHRGVLRERYDTFLQNCTAHSEFSFLQNCYMGNENTRCKTIKLERKKWKLKYQS